MHCVSVHSTVCIGISVLLDFYVNIFARVMFIRGIMTFCVVV